MSIKKKLNDNSYFEMYALIALKDLEVNKNLNYDEWEDWRLTDLFDDILEFVANLDYPYNWLDHQYDLDELYQINQ